LSGKTSIAMLNARGMLLAQARRPVPGLVAARAFTSSWGAGLVSVPIVGRPNVGKSTLFNWLVRAAAGRRGGGSSGAGFGFGGRRPASKAIVSPVAGTTRDRREGPAALAGAQFIAVDTGGLETLDGRSGGYAYGDLRGEIIKQVSI